MTYQFEEYPTRAALIEKLSQALIADLRSALSSQSTISFAVPGGTTPGPIFDRLCQSDLDWARVNILLSDERWVPTENPRSNTALLRNRLLVGAAETAGYVPLYADYATPEDAMEPLSHQLNACLPLSVLLLGMGADMHTASLFPGGDQLSFALGDSAPPLVAMRAPDAPEPRVTLSAAVLNAARYKHLVIFGAEKRHALEQAQSLPAQEAPIMAVLAGTTVHWAD
ncbi:MAG: 6-phosphogluconolactonase [Paracoccaceae bacterium]